MWMHYLTWCFPKYYVRCTLNQEFWVQALAEVYTRHERTRGGTCLIIFYHKLQNMKQELTQLIK